METDKHEQEEAKPLPVEVSKFIDLVAAIAARVASTGNDDQDEAA